MSFRDAKRTARRRLHESLGEPVWYLAAAGEDPVAAWARLHLSFSQLGELLRGGFADRQELTPRIIFLREDVTPVRDAIVVTRDLGAYFIDHDHAPDDITVTAEVIKMTDSQVVEQGMDPNADWLGLTAPTNS